MSRTESISASLALVIACAACVAGCAMQSPMSLGGQGAGIGDPNRSVFAQPATTPVPPSRGKVVIVEEGDTISDLSRKHRVPISVIMSENRLKDPNIFPGMVLLMPRL